jgi:hypothetical protein
MGKQPDASKPDGAASKADASENRPAIAGDISRLLAFDDQSKLGDGEWVFLTFFGETREN